MGSVGKVLDRIGASGAENRVPKGRPSSLGRPRPNRSSKRAERAR